MVWCVIFASVMSVLILSFILIGVGFLLLIADLHFFSYGGLGGTGFIVMLLGTILLDITVGGLVWILLAVLLVLFGLWFYWTYGLIKKSRLTHGDNINELLGESGYIIKVDDDKAWVRIGGELWQAVNVEQKPLKFGDQVTVLAEMDLKLVVRTSKPEREISIK